ncbi:acyltransferase family protein [Micromonospora sp. NPDC050397]|uniref:acyltransferase family protein n=1 Tax=Micromonospora sp. NPDC050397 TaxID=3364279 RepID=UPI00384F02A9
MTAERIRASRVAYPGRRPELDAIRTLVVVGLVLFHSALVFDSRDDFYVKNSETTDVTMVFASLGVVWAMPMLFLVAGLGTWHSLRRRGPAGFALERVRRLGVPLVFATVTLVPLPQWLRLRADPDYHESYPRFLPRFFDVRLSPADFPFVLQGEHFETGHLWFVVLLLTFSLILAPLAAWLPAARMARLRDRAAAAVRHRGVVLLPAVALATVSGALGLEEGFAAWHRWAYLLFFLLGFVLAADDRFRTAMRRDAVPAAVLGLLLFAVGLPGFLVAGESGDPFTDHTALAVGARALYGATGWCWLVAILGLIDRPRSAAPAADTSSRGRRAYAYLAAAVLPLYVLHQPIVVAVAYGVVRWRAPILVGYTAVVVASLVLTVAAYELLVRRTRVTRFLFGMRPDGHSDPPRS